MTKGFKDKSGKFRPTENKNGVRMKRDKSVKTTGVRLKREKYETRTYKVWSYDNAPPEVQQKILENWRNNYSGQDSWYAEDDGILYDTNENFAGYEALKGNIPKYWDLDRGAFIQFELEVKDEKKLAKYLRIPENLRLKVSFNFVNERENNTKIEFHDERTAYEINLDGTYEEYIKYADDEYKEAVTKSEFEILKNASDKWDKLMIMSLQHLKANYEWEFSDEYIIDHVKANDYKFSEDGKID